MKLIFAVALSMSTLTAGARAQDVAAGENSFKKCLPCHSVGEGAKNKVREEEGGTTETDRWLREDWALSLRSALGSREQ